MSNDLDITYAAHTASCTFLLDSEGVCRRVVGPQDSQKTGKTARASSRCLGAQYVASLDANVAGMLAEMPRVGATMLFAKVDDRGRVSLVRTGVVTRFESYREDPFEKPLPSTTVETSAPPIEPSANPAPRFARQSSPPPAEAAPPAPVASGIPDDDATLERTSEYSAEKESARPTLRHPHASTVSEDENPYAAPVRRLPRATTPPPSMGMANRYARRVPPSSSPRPVADAALPAFPLEKVAGRRSR